MTSDQVRSEMKVKGWSWINDHLLHPPSVTHTDMGGVSKLGKSILQVPDTGTRVLDNTRPFLCSSIVSFWITLACSKERKYHIFGQYWYTKNVPVLTNTGTFQYLGPEVYFFRKLLIVLEGHNFIIRMTCWWGLLSMLNTAAVNRGVTSVLAQLNATPSPLTCTHIWVPELWVYHFFSWHNFIAQLEKDYKRGFFAC